MPMDKAEETRDLLNNHVRNAFPNLLELDDHPITLEFEKYLVENTKRDFRYN